MRNLILAITVILVCVLNSFAQSDADKRAITATAMDYVEGWYEGNSERMERALFPELAKRMFSKDEKGKSVFNEMGAMRLVQATRTGYGKNTPQDKQRKDITILDVFETVASVRADMTAWIDYMHLAKVDGRWVIVNVLWELRPPPKQNAKLSQSKKFRASKESLKKLLEKQK